MGQTHKIVTKMMETDAFSQWLGIEVIESKEGYCQLKMTVRPEMCNGFGIIHGGITFSLADSALAFASNAYGRLSVALECSISYPNPVNVGDTLFAEATEVNLSNKIGIYNIPVTNQHGVLVGAFKGTVYRTGKEWEV
ncbi:MAG: hydroxyphenylacetyl-CoA thioesterase PaaI [Flavobacteriales bacterium]|nr:hydroxyphenylacetyl-CoA thioesterase PaaI [Flavobacteriales bacterium]|tara:strand:+ start:182304 stop:182717 length:414 start_codon:yes stop_codon:yes gene_type:complete